MTRVYLGRGGERKALELGRLLGEGASGKVYSVARAPGWAAKLYHDAEEARKYEAKVAAMLAHRPQLPPAMHDGVAHPQIAWPEAKLHDAGGAFIGFLMPEIDFARSTSLVNLLQKNSRRVEKISDYYGYRVLVARNLASVFAELHAAGHHMIDLKPANLRFYPAVSWMAVVDADGFSIAGASGRIGAAQLSDEYIAPESWHRNADALGVEQDLFALAAIIFQLLNNGVHPFAGTAPAGAAATDLQTRILKGLYPYALEPRSGLLPSTASVHRMLRRGTRSMFDAAFLTQQRPSAAAWRDHLDMLLAQLSPCEVKPAEHAHFGAGCGFCAHDARVEAARARPRVPVRPRPTVAPAPLRHPPQQPLSLTHVVAWRSPPRRRSARLGTAAWFAMMVALIGGAAWIPEEDWRGLLFPRAVHAANFAAVLPPTAEELDRLDEPREYRAQARDEAMGADLREGPGEGYAVIASLTPGDDLVGRARSREAIGADWVWVTRLRDGLSGYVHRSDLAERNYGLAATACPTGKVCANSTTLAGERMLTDRFAALREQADPRERALLVQLQGLWETERQRCYALADPAECRGRVNRQQLADLDTWVAIEREPVEPIGPNLAGGR